MSWRFVMMGNGKTLECQAGSDLVEGDIVRIFMGWDEVERHCTRAAEGAAKADKSGLKIS